MVRRVDAGGGGWRLATSDLPERPTTLRSFNEEENHAAKPKESTIEAQVSH